MFTKGKWIWHKDGSFPDQYVDFVKEFNCDGGAFLRIASDSEYTIYINGKLAAFGQYADYPEHKVFDEIDVSDFTVPGKNVLLITVWYYGANSSTYKIGDAGLIYELYNKDGVICQSDEDTRSRISPDYISGVRKYISGQLGLGYNCDLRGVYDRSFKDGFAGFDGSVCVKRECGFFPRPNKKLVLKDRVKSRICMQGVFRYPDERTDARADMQRAFLSHRFDNEFGSGDLSFPFDFKAAENEWIFFIVDLKNEVSGFLDFDITVPAETEMEVGFGEHLTDGRCRTSIRDFSSCFKLKAGRNEFLATFRRFGCRYIQFFIHSSEAKVGYAGLRPTVYPVNVKKPDMSNLLRNTIYEVCENTLLQCMHEHYEDCPWREQAMYALDSRNQMLCGYYAFKEYEFPRACLDLTSRGLREDGLLALTYPNGLDFPIPSFSLAYFISMREYLEHSGDISLAKQHLHILERIISTFTSRMKENGLCPNFRSDACSAYWNFYEWSDSMSGAYDNTKEYYEAPLNAYLSIALQNLSYICEKLGENEKAKAYEMKAKVLNGAIRKQFYDEDLKLFRSFDRSPYDREYITVLTNSLCLLCGAGDGVEKETLLDVLAHNGGKVGGFDVVPNTLSMNSFRFDALLKEDREKYRSVILDEIDRDYLYMLRCGATSFWETLVGESDFIYAGSLCHGWSALPIYYYEILKG